MAMNNILMKCIFYALSVTLWQNGDEIHFACDVLSAYFDNFNWFSQSQRFSISVLSRTLNTHRKVVQFEALFKHNSICN